MGIRATIPVDAPTPNSLRRNMYMTVPHVLVMGIPWDPMQYGLLCALLQVSTGLAFFLMTIALDLSRRFYNILYAYMMVLILYQSERLTWQASKLCGDGRSVLSLLRDQVPLYTPPTTPVTRVRPQTQLPVLLLSASNA